MIGRSWNMLGRARPGIAGLLLLGWSLPAAAAPEVREVGAQLVGSHLHFTGRLRDSETTVAHVEVRYRAADLSMRTAEMQLDRDRLLAIVDAGPLFLGSDSVRVLYSVVARDLAGEILARVGSDEEPLSVIVTRVFNASVLDQPDDPLVTAPAPEDAEADDPPVAWWVWTIGAVVVVGAGVAVGVVLAR